MERVLTMTHRTHMAASVVGSLLAVLLCVAAPRAMAGSSPEALFHAAQAEVTGGGHLDAADKFIEAADLFKLQAKPAREAASLYNYALCCHHLGNYKLAYDALDRALACVNAEKSPQLRSQIVGLAGTVSTFALKTESAEKRLTESLAEARGRKDRKSVAWLHNDLGIFHAARGEWPQARESFESSASEASALQMPGLHARAQMNKALASLNEWSRKWQMQRVLGEDDPFADDVEAEQNALFVVCIKDAISAEQAATGLEPGFDQVLCLLTVGDVWKTLGRSPRAPEHKTKQHTFENLSAALKLAQKLDVKPLLSQGLGMMAEVYREAGRLDEAMRLNEAALRTADEQGVMGDLFRWEWQRGRLLVAAHRHADALPAYERASSALTRVRHDIAVGYGNRNLGLTFREAVGSMFFEHADLVLATADGEKEDSKLQAIYAQARGIVEELKSAELVDYFQDACLNLLREKDKDVSRLDTGDAAVVYAMPFADRTEILVSHRGRTERFRSPITAGELELKATRWRRELETLGSFDCMLTAKELNDALIKPIEARMHELKVKTLVFVPDGALRLVPMAALHDGESFLIERFGIAVTPGLTLTDPSSVTRGPDTQLLLGALTQAVQGFPALPAVSREVAGISGVLKVHIMKDEAFLKQPFTDKVTSNVFRIMHVASHGEFKDDSADTFVLTFDDRIHLNELETMIRPRQYEGTPVELLCLSACKTAAGDDRAALGLAGVAVKCGARAALASLWYVSDEVTSRLMTDFYRRLFKDTSVTKSAALRQAQIDVLKDVRFNHPGYWAPYLLIGNWL